MKLINAAFIGIGLLSVAHAQSGRLIGPFVLGSGNWNTIQYGGFDNNLNGWGGMGATPMMYLAHGTAPTNEDQLPYFPRTGVLRYGFAVTTSQNITFAGWLAGSVPQNVIGQRYVLSAFVNVKGRQFYHPAESHVVQMDKGAYNYVRTSNTLGGHDGWQFIYVTFTATGYQGGSFPLMIVNEFRQCIFGQEIEWDEIAVTREEEFALPIVEGNGQTTVTGQVQLDGVAGPRPRTAYFEIIQVPTGMRLATRQELNPDGSFSFNVGNYGFQSTFKLKVKPDTGLAYQAEGEFILDGNSVGFPLLPCVNGDIDGDNEVGPGDFGILATKFGLAQGDNGYLADADLDGDEEIGPGDFGILARNFGLAGD